MKKFLIVISVFFTLLFAKGCFPTEYYDIVDVNFSAVGMQNSKGETVIRDGLQFDIYYELEFQRASRKAYHYIPELVQKCYATTFPKAMGNQLLWNSFSLSFNKPFTFKNQTIPAGTNILEAGGVKDEMMVYEIKKDDYNIFDRAARIDFSKSFIENSVFDGSYKVEFSCETTDGRLFLKYTTIVFI